MNIGGQTVKQVCSFRYLRSLVCEGGKCDAEIRSKLYFVCLWMHFTPFSFTYIWR